MLNLKTFFTQSVIRKDVRTIDIIKPLGLGMGIIYTLFVFLEPFQFYTSVYNKFVVFLLFSASYFVVLFIAIKWIFPFVNTLVNLKKYYFYHFVLGYLFLIILVAFTHHLLQNYLNEESLFNFELFIEILVNAFFVGLIPVFILSLLSYNRALQKEIKSSTRDLTQLLKEVPQEGNLSIKSQNDKEVYQFTASTILFIKSEDNYINVIYKDLSDNGVKTELIRTTLKKVEDHIELPFLRVHRSYIVNLNNVFKIAGNSQGMQLFIKEQKPQIPVSRSYVENLKKAIGVK